jgi:hypothetical protein
VTVYVSVARERCTFLHKAKTSRWTSGLAIESLPGRAIEENEEIIIHTRVHLQHPSGSKGLGTALKNSDWTNSPLKRLTPKSQLSEKHVVSESTPSDDRNRS